jgi:hypothetical protein
MVNLVILVFSNILSCFFAVPIFNAVVVYNRNTAFFYIFYSLFYRPRESFLVFFLFSRFFVINTAISAAINSHFVNFYFSVANR